ncbi:aldehyde dehydrogenase family protein [Frankia sp. Cas3]|uniref:aldehyde dehydrogenase family protein n=1 Tax=Frankia sp. Cas3 TaxID=3073926 RepID=UPI002AD1DA2F|nr:aldehyde dehydrogenase family protein [Frankia sp. Cas3]
MTVLDADLTVLPNPGLLIGDGRVSDSSEGEFTHVYAATGKPTRGVSMAGAGEVDAAVRAARAALPGWRATPLDRRRELLLEAARLIRREAATIAQLTTIDNGTPSMIAASTPLLAADLFTYNAGWADKIGGEVVGTWPVPALDYTLDEPYGVVGVIVPWNGPVVSVGQIVAPALAAGNCVVLKPSELAPWGCLRIGELLLEAGFPPGVINVVPGGPAGGQALVSHPDVDKIHFTGGGQTAKRILASALETLKPVGLELGGKSANLVFEDADLVAAAQQAMTGAVLLSGQGCILGTRILVQRSIHDAFLATLAAILGQIPVGDPSAATSVMGPVVSEGAADRILGMVATAQKEGNRLLTGGERLGGDLADGWFIGPTVLADVAPTDFIAQNEVFGPVLAVTPFDTEADAVAIANATPYGLAAYVQTDDLRRAHRVCAALEAGNIWVNGFLGIPPGAPFGGVKQSGQGRLGGIHAIREFTRPKNVWMAL